jgi:hypothetical protein
MRKLLALILVLAGLWAGYWAVGARAVETGLEGWIEARQAEGWAADYATLDTRGFPNRFDTTITDLRLADPETGLSWSLPFFQILALSYKPNHIIAVLPDRQVVATPLEKVEIGSERIRGSVVFAPGPALALERADFNASAVELDAATGWQAALGEGRFAMHRLEVAEARYRLGADILALEPAEAARRALDPTGTLPAEIEALKLDATIDFTRPWDRHAIEDARPQPTRLALDNLQASWGRLDLRAAGALEIDEAGRATGSITVKATNWREMLDIAVAAGALPERLAGPVETGLAMLAGLSGPPETLDAPLTFRDGQVNFGPIPLGPAPRFVIR